MERKILYSIFFHQIKGLEIVRRCAAGKREAGQSTACVLRRGGRPTKLSGREERKRRGREPISERKRTAASHNNDTKGAAPSTTMGRRQNGRFQGGRKAQKEEKIELMTNGSTDSRHRKGCLRFSPVGFGSLADTFCRRCN